MAVLAGDAHGVSHIGGGHKIQGPAHQADTFWGGALLFALNVGTTGKVSCVPTAGTNERFLGISSKKQVIAAADDPVEYYFGGLWLFPAIASIAATDMGGYLVADKSGTISDNPADLVFWGTGTTDITPVAGDIIIGRIVGRDGSGNLYVDLSVGGINFVNYATTPAVLALL